MVYKVLLVDDEPIILSGIKFLICWEDYGARISATARNGIEALEKIGKEHPDIIICDMKMPLMDGMELLKQCSEKYPEIVFIILTNLEEFTLAKETIKYSAIDYLLKTELDETSLTESLNKAILESKKRSTLIQTRYDSFCEEESIKKLIQSIFQIREVPRESLALLLKENLLDSYAFIGFYLEYPDTGYSTEDEHDFSKLFEWQGEIIEKILPTYCSIFYRAVPITNKRNLHLYFISGIDELSWHRTIEVIKEKISNASMMVTGREIEIAYTKLYSGSEALIECRNEFEYLSSLRYLEKSNAHCSSLDLDRIYPKLERIISSNDAEGFSLCMDRICSSIKGNDHHLSQALFIAEGIISALRSGIKKSGLHFEGEEIIDSFVKSLIYINRRSELIFSLENLKESFHSLLHTRQRDKNGIITKAKEFINANLKRQISLSEVAEAASVSPAYMSALFKKRTGISMVDYVNQCKMDLAKEFMDNGMVRITDIADKLGYKNVYYFSKVFKKTCKQTPSEYVREIADI